MNNNALTMKNYKLIINTNIFVNNNTIYTH